MALLPHEEVEENFNTDHYNSIEDSFIYNNRLYLQESRRRALVVSDNSEIQEHDATGHQFQLQEVQHHSKNWEVDLIEEVRNYDCLWNTTSRAFKETPKKAEAWRQISAKLNIEG